MESSRVYYYWLKAAGICFLAVCFYAPITAVFFPGEIHSEAPLSTGERVFIATALPALGLLVSFVGWRAAHVKIQSRHLEVSRNGKRLEVPWAEVAGITKLPFTTPPIYWIKFHDLSGVAVIARSWIVLSIGFWSWDFSKFRESLEVRIVEAIRDLNRT
jgi:hypothetical protein